MKHAWKQPLGFNITGLATASALLLSVASHATNVAPDDLFLPPSVITNGYYNTHVLTMGTGTNVIQTYTSDNEGGTLLGVRILPILHPNPRPTSFQGEYTPDDLANINVTNYSQFFLCQPGTDYFADLTPGAVTLDYRASGQYFVEIRAENNGVQFTNVYVDRVDDYVGQGESEPAEKRRQVIAVKGDVCFVGSTNGGDNATNHFLEIAAKVLNNAGKPVVTVGNVDAIISAAADAYAARGSNQVEIMLVAHGEPLTNKETMLPEWYGIIIGNQVITTAEDVSNGYSADRFQTNIDKYVRSIHLYCCNVGQDAELMDTFSNSLQMVTAFTNKIQVNEKGTLQTNADKTVTLVKGFSIPEGATELVIENPSLGLSWNNPLGGSWSDFTNWNGDSHFFQGWTNNGCCDPGFIQHLTNDMTLTIDREMAVSRMYWSDRSCRHVFFLDPGSGGRLRLTATNGVLPAIFVYDPTTTTINAPVTATDGFMKFGEGTLNLGASNSITGPVIVKFGTLRVGNPSALGTTNSSAFIASGATLALTNAGSISNCSSITVASGATLDGLGRSDGMIFLGGTEVLTGNGTIRGNVTVGPFAKLSPGTSSGMLTITNGNLTLQGTTVMTLNKAAQTHNLICGPSNILYGGTLIVSNLSGTLTITDSFKLFDAGNYSGAFTNIIPATPGGGSAWNTNTLTTDGTLRVANTMAITNVYALGCFLIANPLECVSNGVTNNAVNVVLTNISCPSCVSGGLTLYFWDPVLQLFSSVLTYYDADDAAPGPVGWYDDVDFNYASNTISPGEGAVLLNSANTFRLTFQGAWPGPQAPLSLEPGKFYLRSPRPPFGSGLGHYEDIMGAAPVVGSTVLMYQPGGNPSHFGPPDYACYSYGNGGWSPHEPLVPVGESVFVTLRPTLSLQMNPPEQGVITWDAPANWTLQTATDLNGPWVDLPSAASPFPVSLSGQCFYRLRGP